ncbi:DUF2461 domain-containing protein [Thalassococcus sp. S3]|uniref:DUF2461 domain-containing protein n=1 Tax=Thalassococcus sp. S3 TaxID=2017482 RepID=UPI0010248EE5|nr:DUF2461 domain-containing protein [Thalassococcus sp. S3]QBF32011.1 hypothetical protein CFI11_12375 [Thalassococcus sp. S3]
MTQPEGFSQMILDANVFYKELAENNNREWFEERKAHFTDSIRKPAELFATIAAEEITRETGLSHKPKVFRIYRDVRFSKDKTPYNTHLHIYWEATDGGPMTPGFFFASSPTSFELLSGIPSMKGEELTKFRAFVDKHGDDLDAVIEETGATLSTWGADPLKRVPSPYDKEHPHAEHLKRKSLILGVGIDPDPNRELLARVMEAMRRLRPLQTLLKENL